MDPDASMLVTETIKVVSAGDRIQRGIYRDFPTTYKDRAEQLCRGVEAYTQTLREVPALQVRIELPARGFRFDALRLLKTGFTWYNSVLWKTSSCS